VDLSRLGIVSLNLEMFRLDKLQSIKHKCPIDKRPNKDMMTFCFYGDKNWAVQDVNSFDFYVQYADL
jgi:hypothetical protein